MGNVLRVLGIVVASMLLGLVGLFLLLFTICGGLQSSDGGGVLAVCLVLIVGAIALIVFLGRGISSSRAAARGLAVAPAVPSRAYGVPPPGGLTLPSGAPTITPPSPYGAPPYVNLPAGPGPAAQPPVAAQRPVVPLRPLGTTDVQVLVGLRIALVVYVLLSFGSMVSSAISMNRFGHAVGVQLVLRSILGALPVIAVLIAVSVRTPPAGAALDAAAGFGAASILFRIGTFGAMAMTPAFSAMANVPFLLLRLGAFSALEALIAGLALHVRGSVGGLSLGGLAVATIAFLVWHAVIQVAMQMLATLMY
jgi:hypothetical protein